MSNVLFKRGDNKTLDQTPVQDGLLYFNEENHRIYMDNGSTRYQYGGTVDLISDQRYATVDNAFNASASLQLFMKKGNVIDDVESALVVTSPYIPLGCLAFKNMIGTTSIAHISNGTVSGALNMLYGEVQTKTLAANTTKLIFDFKHLLDTSVIEIYTDAYGFAPKTVVTNTNKQNITMTFKAQTQARQVKCIVRNLEE